MQAACHHRGGTLRDPPPDGRIMSLILGSTGASLAAGLALV